MGGTLGCFKLCGLPAGVSVSALALVSSLLAFFAVWWVTRETANQIDVDARVVMEE